MNQRFYYPPGTAWKELPDVAVRVLRAIVATPTENVGWGREWKPGDQLRPWGSTWAGGGEDFSARWANVHAQTSGWPQVFGVLGLLQRSGVLASGDARNRRLRPNSFALRVSRLRVYAGDEFQPHEWAIDPQLVDHKGNDRVVPVHRQIVLTRPNPHLFWVPPYVEAHLTPGQRAALRPLPDPSRTPSA